MLQFHHTGLLVRDIDEALTTFFSIHGENRASEKFYIASQKVYVCFVDQGNNSFIELVSPEDEQSTVYKMLKKGINFYHIAYSTTTLDKEVERLTQLNFKPLGVFHSEAFKGKRCIFLISPDAFLIELIETDHVI